MLYTKNCMKWSHHAADVMGRQMCRMIDYQLYFFVILQVPELLIWLYHNMTIWVNIRYNGMDNSLAAKKEYHL